LGFVVVVVVNEFLLCCSLLVDFESTFDIFRLCSLFAVVATSAVGGDGVVSVAEDIVSVSLSLEEAEFELVSGEVTPPLSVSSDASSCELDLDLDLDEVDSDSEDRSTTLGMPEPSASAGEAATNATRASTWDSPLMLLREVFVPRLTG